jgi:hypothetical protein
VEIIYPTKSLAATKRRMKIRKVRGPEKKLGFKAKPLIGDLGG